MVKFVFSENGRELRVRIHKMGLNFRRYILNVHSEESRKLLIFLATQQDCESNLRGKEHTVTVNGLVTKIFWFDDSNPLEGEEDDSGWVLLASEPIL